MKAHYAMSFVCAVNIKTTDTMEVFIFKVSQEKKVAQKRNVLNKKIAFDFFKIQLCSKAQTTPRKEIRQPCFLVSFLCVAQASRDKRVTLN